MRVLVCGGRDFDDWNLFCKTMRELGFVGEEKLNDLTIIEGGAIGADFMARIWSNWLGVEYEEYPADWKQYGIGAGVKRNIQMLETKPDLVVAFPGGRGTAHMVKIAKEAGVEVYEVQTQNS